MSDFIKYFALIICLAGLVIWHLCLRLKEPPTGLAETGRIMFGVGLLGLVMGK